MSLKNFTYRDLPKNRVVRIILGILLIIGGILWFLPVVGFWMIPLGLLFLSMDFPFARRLRRRTVVWWGKRQRKKAQKKND